MCQNPATAVLVLGHSQGTVTMWTPNMKVSVSYIVQDRKWV